MELSETVKCLLCRGRQPFDKRCFDEMEMHLKSQHRVIFFMKELIQCTKDAKNKEEILASQTIDVDMAVKQEDEGDIIVEYEHFSTSEQTVDEGGDSIVVEDDDIPTSEREYSTDSLMEADASANEVLEDLPVASAQDSGGVPACVNKPEIYNANQAAINFNPAIVASISDKHPVDIAARCDVNNAVDIIDENFVELNTTFPIVNERNEDLTDLLREQSNANIEPMPELTNNCNLNNLNNQLTLNSSVEALIDNLMSTESFVNDMNWIVQTENTKIGEYPDSFDKDASLLYYTSEKSPESSSFLHPSNSKASLEMSNGKELHVNIQEEDNTSNDECNEILTSNGETASILDKLDAFVDTPTRIMEIIHKPSETVDTTVLPSTDTKSSLDISKGSVKLASDKCESPQKSKGWYDLVPRGNASKKQSALVFNDISDSSDISTNNRKRRMIFDKVQSESKKKFKSPLDSVSFYENDKKEQALNDKKKLKCDECNMRYASKQTLKNHVCKGHALMFKIKKCRVNLHTIAQKETAIKESHVITHKESRVQYESPANNNLISCKKQGCTRMFENPFELKDHEFSVHFTSGPRDHTEKDIKDESCRKLGGEPLQGYKDKGKPFVCEGCGKPFSSDHGKKVHKMKMHS